MAISNKEYYSQKKGRITKFAILRLTIIAVQNLLAAYHWHFDRQRR